MPGRNLSIWPEAPGRGDEPELNVAVAELETLGVSQEATSQEVLDAAEASYQETKTKIENLGAVNPTAWEEFQEAQQRHDFLTAQRQDLLDSIRDREKAIEEIDEYSKNKFTEAFVAINENFKQAFQTLFGGGSGEMRLTDETNVNDSGIDIIASPPGKKLQNVLLLSGGEKALGDFRHRRSGSLLSASESRRRGL